MHVKTNSNAEAVRCSGSDIPSSRLSDIMRHAAGAILQHPSSAHGKSLRGLHVFCLEPAIGGDDPKQHHLALSEA